MPDNILRSGVPHAVETNLVTRHAINPRHSFSDQQRVMDTNPAEGVAPAPSEHSPKGANAPVVPPEAWADNWQATDTQHPQDNWQSLDHAHVQDNLQALPQAHHSDNLQNAGGPERIEEKKLYLEKKSIRDNRQKVATAQVTRAAPQGGAGESPLAAGLVASHSVSASATVPVHSSVPAAVHASVDASATARHRATGEQARQALKRDAAAFAEVKTGASKSSEDDALRARMKKLKATVRDINDSLRDLDPKP